MGLFGRVARYFSDRRSQAELRVEDARFTVLDTELTGLDDGKDDIVSIGAVRMRGGRLSVGGSFYELVNPTAVLDGKSVVIHRITPSQIEEKPPIDAVLPAFLDYLGDTVVVGHCLTIDLNFLNREARRVVGAPLANPALDTMSLYGWLRHRQPEHPAFQLPLSGLSLFRLAEAFEIHVEKAHTALGDAYVTAQLLQRFLPMMAAQGVTHLADLLRIGDPRRQVENLTAPGGQMHF